MGNFFECKGCSDRHPACWGKCEKYKAAHEKTGRENAAKRAYLKAGNRPYYKSKLNAIKLKMRKGVR